MTKGVVLVADDDAAIRTVLNQAFTRAGFEVRVTSNIATLWRWVSAGEGDVVVSDVMMPDGEVFDVLPEMKKLRPELPIIIMSAQNTFMTAITASEKGAYEYFPKPFDLQEMTATAGRAIAEPKKSKLENEVQPSPDNMPMIGRSPAMQEIYRMLARLMQTDLTLMITGESGTGKELVARALHDYGKRKSGPFVAINMATIPKDLIEAELFGQESQSSNETPSRVAGRFELAEGGTLFLDEIGDMPLDAQMRLLRVLEQGEYTPVGGRKLLKTNVRIIAATNKDLQAQIKQGAFREDLFYRLNVVPMRIPPLRERSEDIPDLITHFLEKNNKDGAGPKTVHSDALQNLKKYAWPGNVRELENLVQRLIALYQQEVITALIIESELQKNTTPQFVAQTGSEPLADISMATELWVVNYFGKFGEGTTPPGLYHKVLKQMEKPLIAASLAHTRGNQIKAAEMLGLNRNTLRKKIRDLEIQVMKSPY